MCDFFAFEYLSGNPQILDSSVCTGTYDYLVNKYVFHLVHGFRVARQMRKAYLRLDFRNIVFYNFGVGGILIAFI